MPQITLPCTRSWQYEYWGWAWGGPYKVVNRNNLFMGEQQDDDNGTYFTFPLFDFDWSQLPTNIIINSAKLQVYPESIGHVASNGWIMQIMRVTAQWPEPAGTGISSTTTNMVEAFDGNLINTKQWSNIDITGIVRDSIAYGKYGVMFFVKDGYRVYAGANFWSYGSANAPRLVIDYTPANTKPNPPNLNGPANGSITNNGNPHFSWSFSDNDAGDYQTAWQMQISAGDGGAFTNIVGDTGKVSNGDQSWTWNANLGDNQYFWRMRTWDRYDAISDWSWVPWFGVERQPPTGTVQGKTYQAIQPNGTFRVHAYNVTDNWSGVQIVKFPTAGPGKDFVWYDGVNAGGGTWYCDISINNYWNNEGVYTTHVYAYDNAGNNQMLGGVDTIVDRTAPTVSITSPVDNYATKDRRVSITWSYNDTNPQKSYFIEIVNNSYSASLWNSGWIDDTNARSYLLPDMGSYIAFYVRMSVKDQAGNISGPIEATNKRIVVDNSPPTISSVQGYGYTNQKTGTRRVWFYGVTDDLSGIGGTYASYNNPAGTNTGLTAYASGSDYYVDVPLSAEGEYVVYFQAVDRAGNLSATVYSKFFIDSQRANDPNASVVWGDTEAVFTWSEFSDPTPSSGRATTDFYLGEWNGSGWVGTPLFNGQDIGDVTSKYVNGLKPGTRYRYTVTYHDKAGNESSYAYREFVTKKKVGEFVVGGKSGSKIALPVYDPTSGVLGSKAYRVGVKSGAIGCFELVATTDPSASPYRVSTPQGLRAISK
ncbi:hypothetical protein GCM10023310_01030 [Paenibacillus vulneris]|uniref:GBS Bsp-like repeat-containing protein n=1 Tax=Paenibacillus vulneris TaxID=1133364 RepID=A0ABW3UX77_9BACL